jgi:hypothetical protein
MTSGQNSDFSTAAFVPAVPDFSRCVVAAQARQTDVHQHGIGPHHEVADATDPSL